MSDDFWDYGCDPDEKSSRKINYFTNDGEEKLVDIPYHLIDHCQGRRTNSSQYINLTSSKREYGEVSQISDSRLIENGMNVVASHLAISSGLNMSDITSSVESDGLYFRFDFPHNIHSIEPTTGYSGHMDILDDYTIRIR